MAYLLDTNILSETRRSRPHPAVTAFMDGCPVEDLFVSSVVLAEIRFGIECTVDPEDRAKLSAWLKTRIRPMFLHRVLEITEDVIVRWRLLVEKERKAGRTSPQPDLFIGATALEHNLTLVTRNVKDFAGLGVTILNPWEQQI